MKKKQVQPTSLSDEVDYNVPDYKTVITVISKDQLNITLSKCGLTMLSNLGTVRKWLVWTELKDFHDLLIYLLFYMSFFRHLQRLQNRRLRASRKINHHFWWRTAWVCPSLSITAACFVPSCERAQTAWWIFRMVKLWGWTILPQQMTISQPWSPWVKRTTTYSQVSWP